MTRGHPHLSRDSLVGLCSHLTLGSRILYKLEFWFLNPDSCRQNLKRLVTLQDVLSQGPIAIGKGLKFQFKLFHHAQSIKGETPYRSKGSQHLPGTKNSIWNLPVIDLPLWTSRISVSMSPSSRCILLPLPSLPVLCTSSFQ